jgi:transposase
VAQVNDLSRSLTAFDPISTLVVVVEMSKASWLVSGAVPGVERQPLKKLEPDATALLRLIERWRNEAVRAGRPISRIALAYEAGRDGFWLARWLIARGIEAHVIHSASVAVSRERKRAKTDRLDAAMLMRVFLGWLRGERGHCGMVAIPTMEEEDARRPSRERESLVNERSRITNRMKSALARLGVRGFKPHLRKAPERLAGLRTAEGTGLPANIIEEFRRDMARLALVREQISSIEKTRAERLERAPDTGPHAMVRLLARVIGIGIETADMLVREILSRKLRDQRAVARYAGLTGSPDESGLKRRGPQAALIAESFKPNLRYSGASLGYQLASIIAGGPAPIIATWLFATYHSGYAISVYIAVLAVISFIATALMPDYTGKDISDDAYSED